MAAPSTRKDVWRLMEREGETDAIVESVARARDGVGTVLVIEGAAGLGKSGLLQVATDVALDAGVDALTATGRRLEKSFRFGVTLQLLERRVAAAERPLRRELLAGPAGAVEPLFAGRPAAREFDARAEAALVHGLYWLCARIAARGPVALCVDDLQWVDAPSLRFLNYLAQRSADLPIALIATRLDPPGDAPDALVAELGRRRSARVVRLRPLSEAAVGRQVRGTLFPDADDRFCHAVFEASRGNPFYLKELLVEVGARGLRPTSATARAVAELVPAAIAESVSGRLAALGREATELARGTAVLGDGCGLAQAADLAGLSRRNAVKRARRLIAADLLTGDSRLGFVHPVVRRAVLADLPPMVRADAHLRAAHIIHELGASPEAVADHLLQARPEADAWAVAILREAAARALAAGSPGAAMRYLRRALEEPPPRATLPAVTLELGRAEATSGDVSAGPRLSAVIELLREPRERATAALYAGRALFAVGHQAAAAESLRRGIAALADRDDPLRGRLEAALFALKRLALPGDELPSVAPAAESPVAPPAREEAPRSATRVETEHRGAAAPAKAPDAGATPALLAHAAFERALAGVARGEAEDLAARALRGGALLDDEGPGGLTYYLAPLALACAEKLDAADRALTAALERARQRGSVHGPATAFCLRAAVALRAGRVDDAARDARRAVGAAREGWRLALPGAHAVLIEALIERDELAAARRHLGGVDERELEGGLVVGSTDLFHAARGRLRLLQGDPEAALRDFEACGRLHAAAGASNPSLLGWRSYAASAAAQLRDCERARQLVDEELTLARAWGAAGAISRALRVRARFDRGDASLEALAEATQLLRGSEMTLERARALVDFGSALRRRRQRRRAREPLRKALELAERAGSRTLAERARDELAVAGARPRRTAVSGVESLTPRERRVAELAADGLSNREIAATLFVTIKTVEWHLKHVYKKLEIRSRRDLPRALTRGFVDSGRPDRSDGKG